MPIDLPSEAGGFAIASILLGWLASYVFVTKNELAKHEKEDRDRSDRMLSRLFEKVDGIDSKINDLRVDVATKYSRGGAGRPEGAAS